MTDVPRVKSYEIHLHKADGTLSIIMTANALGLYGAKLEARRMLKADIAYAIIWRNQIEVATVRREKLN